MDEQKNLHYFPDGSSTELPADQLAELREKALGLLETDAWRLLSRSCWLCNPAHLHLSAEEPESYLLRCFGCGRFFLDGKDLTDYSPVEPELATA